MFHLKTGSHFTIIYCENNRENSQSKLVTQDTSTCHNCRYLKEINAFLIPCKTVYKTTRKKLKYISCWYTLRKVFSFAVTNVSWLVYRSWTMPCRFRVLAQVKTGILGRSRAAPQWKKCCFRIVARNETTPSLFFWENKQGCSPFIFPFLLSSSFPFFLFPRRTASHFPRLSTFVSLGPLTRYNVAKFNPIYFTTKLKSSQCVLDVVESPPVHSCVLIFSWCFSLYQYPPSVQGNSGRISLPEYQIFLSSACGFSLCIFLCRQMIPLQEINAKQLGNEITSVSYNAPTFALEPSKN